MTDAEKLKAYAVLIDHCDSLALNMNDTFARACADSEDMASIDVPHMLPIIARHGSDALVAYVAVKCSIEPITYKCSQDGLKPYEEAKKEILALKESEKFFLNPDFA